MNNNPKETLDKYREIMDLPFNSADPNKEYFDPIADLKKQGVKDKMVVAIYNAALSIGLKILKALMPKASKFLKQWIQDNIEAYIPVIEEKVKELEKNAKATPKMGDDILAFVIRAFFEIVKSLLKVGK